MSTSTSRISAWGNGLALRLTRPMAATAGVAEGSPVRVTVKPGLIVIEADVEPTLKQMLAAYDPKKHGREVAAGRTVGREAFAAHEQELTVSYQEFPRANRSKVHGVEANSLTKDHTLAMVANDGQVYAVPLLELTRNSSSKTITFRCGWAGGITRVANLSDRIEVVDT